MQSSLPKVLHRIGGKPMLQHVLDVAKKLSPMNLFVVYGHAGDQVKAHFNDPAITWIHQVKQCGTGDAVAQALPHIPEDHRVLILYGDVPLIQADTLMRLLKETSEEMLGLVTADVDEPFGLGRIIRDPQGKVKRIVEEKETTEQERQLKEVNSGIMVFGANALTKWLPKIHNRNVKGEFYLTDAIALAVEEGKIVHTVSPQSLCEIAGVNDRSQQAILERQYQRIQAEKYLAQGVEVSDPARVDIRGELLVDQEVQIDINTIFEGKNILHKGCRIGAHCILIDCEVGEGAEILPYSHLEGARVGQHARVGPFARLRPGTVLADFVHIGNFVEVKKSQIGETSKVNHLSYIGDAKIGQGVNIGAGTITCNYDGMNKHETIIEDGVHIGSDTQLVAPIRIGKGATVGAGSTVTKDVPAHLLTLTHRLEQRSRAAKIRNGETSEQEPKDKK